MKELHRMKQRKAIQKASGIFNQKDYPELNTSEDISKWVRNLRKESEARRRELLK